MFGIFGMTISQALKTEFFQWFHLENTGKVPEGTYTRMIFQPSAPQFHDLVSVSLTIDQSQTLHAVSLAIKRSFIDSPTNNTLAADITKSFMTAVLESPDIGQMSGAISQIRRYEPESSRLERIALAKKAAPAKSAVKNQSAEVDDTEEIWQKMKKAIDKGAPVYATMRPVKSDGSRFQPAPPDDTAPLAPGEGEPAYLAYSGKRRHVERQITGGLFRMENGKVDGAEQLVISVKAA